MTDKTYFKLSMGRLNRPYRKLTLVVLLSAYCIIGPVAAKSDVARLLENMQPLTLHEAHMDFADYLSNVELQELEQQAQLLDRLVQQFNGIMAKQLSLSRCDVIALDDAEFVLGTAKNRLSLLRSHTDEPRPYQGSFAHFNDNNRWYLHWLSSWLQDNVTIDELERMARNELEQVGRKRALLASKDLHTVQGAIPKEQSTAIINAFRQRESVIRAHLSRVFGTDFVPDSVNIVESTLPKSFPAPGIYNPESREFIYHLSSDEFPHKHTDWLFLHEGVPGHHYFNEFANAAAECAGYQSPHGSTLFTEGWAAYVETLGEQLGVFTDRSSQAYALDWQALRAVRVLLDIGIHTQDWSDAEAAKIWMRYIPEQQPIMAREIARIRRWPVQAITYVYGKQTIEQAIHDTVLRGDHLTKADAHLAILNLSNFSLRSLSQLQLPK